MSTPLVILDRARLCAEDVVAIARFGAHVSLADAVRVALSTTRDREISHAVVLAQVHGSAGQSDVRGVAGVAGGGSTFTPATPSIVICCRKS